MQTVGTDAIAGELSGYPEVWLRIGAVKDPGDNPWQLRVAEIVAGGQPPNWRGIQWLYPNARFEAVRVAGSTAAKAIVEGRFFVAGTECQVVALPELVQRDRRPSRAVYASSPALDWPSDEYRIPVTAQLNASTGELISDIAPPFTSFDLGLANLLGSGHQSSPPSREVVVRVLDTRGRIDRVYVDPAYAEVVVSGNALLTSSLSLAADTPGESRILSADTTPRTERFETPMGTPPGAWIALIRNGTLLDRRNVDLTRIRSPEPGVTYAAPAPVLDEDAPYSAEEQERLREVIGQIRLMLPAQFPDIPSEQLLAFDEALDEAAGTLPNLPRKLWNRLAFGTIGEAIGKDVITKLAGDAVVALLRFGVLRLPGIRELPLPFE